MRNYIFIFVAVVVLSWMVPRLVSKAWYKSKKEEMCRKILKEGCNG